MRLINSFRSRASKSLAVLGLCLWAVGCGYTTRSALPSEYQTIFVASFKNKIDYTAEAKRNLYLPLLELKVRQAIVNRFQFDGSLRLAKDDKADLKLSGELTGYEREVLQYTNNNDVQEYRIRIVVNMILTDTATDEIVWEEPGFAGEATYFPSGPLSRPESAAVEEATIDLAKRVVERTIENW